jgi:hypothetical protein
LRGPSPALHGEAGRRIQILPLDRIAPVALGLAGMTRHVLPRFDRAGDPRSSPRASRNPDSTASAAPSIVRYSAVPGVANSTMR